MPVPLPPDTPALVGLAFVASFALTALARRVARPLGFLDRPDGRRKLHSRPMPVLGGAAIFAALVCAVLAFLLAGPRHGAGLESAPLVPLLTSAALACLIGLWDDRRPLRARTKLLLQFAASVPFVVWGRSIESIHLLGYQVELGWAGYAFTAFWLVACANIINLIDGLDGLATTVGLIVAASIAGLAAMKGIAAVTVLALLFAGCLLGFLVHNWPPARIFLGDSGSLLIGFVVGALAIEASLKTATGFALAVPLVLLSVPVFDTAMAIARRILAGRGIGEGDRLHIHHRLQARGLSRGQALLAISGLCTAMAAVTLLSARFKSDVVGLGMCVCLLALLIYGRVFGYEETLMFLRRARATLVALAAYARSDVPRVVRVLSADDPDWDAAWIRVVRQLEALGARSLELTIAPESEAPVQAATTAAYRRTWRRDASHKVEPQGHLSGWHVALALHRPAGGIASVAADGSSSAPVETVPLDAVRLLAALCRHWPGVSATVSAESTAAPTIPLHSDRVSTDAPDVAAEGTQESDLRAAQATRRKRAA
jgi:UDP-GlcNAc:undecaprenyl-phosphate GlcNAc-1-phosphate transferase